MDVNRKEARRFVSALNAAETLIAATLSKYGERATHPQLLVLRRMRIWVWDRRLGVDPKSKLSRAVTPDGEAADYCQTFIFIQPLQRGVHCLLARTL